VQVVGVSFLCKLVDGEVKLSEELESYEWVDLGEEGLLEWLKKEIRNLK